MSKEKLKKLSSLPLIHFSVSCYKHPEGIPLFNITQVPLNDMATNMQQVGNGSFQTHNELNLSDIIIHDPPVAKPVSQM